jgi:hypothetical protein
MRRNTLIDVEFVTLEHEYRCLLVNIKHRWHSELAGASFLFATDQMRLRPWRELSSGIRKNLTRISYFPEGAPIATDRGAPTVQPPLAN